VVGEEARDDWLLESRHQVCKDPPDFSLQVHQAIKVAPTDNQVVQEVIFEKVLNVIVLVGARKIPYEPEGHSRLCDLLGTEHPH